MPYDCTVERFELQALVDIKGASEHVREWCGKAIPPFPESPGAISARDDEELYWVGQNHWLLRAPLSQEDHVLSRLNIEDSPAKISIVQVSDMYVFYSLTGNELVDALSTMTSIDFCALPTNSATFTESFGLKTLMVKRPNKFELAFDRSYTEMLDLFFVGIAKVTRFEV